MSVESILAQLIAERDRLDRAIKALSSVTSTKTNRGGRSSGGKRKRRVLSADARKRIAEAQRQRWARQKAGKK